MWAGVCGRIHTALWSIGQSVLRADFRCNHSPWNHSFQNCKCHHKRHRQSTPSLYIMTNILKLWRDFLIFQVISYQNKTLRQCSKLKLNQEKIGLFVFKRYLKLLGRVVSLRERKKSNKTKQKSTRKTCFPRRSQLGGRIHEVSVQVLVLCSAPEWVPVPLSTTGAC